MKFLITTAVACALILGPIAPIVANAGCSYNGYVNSGGKCAKSWHKKNGKSYERVEIKTKIRSSSNQYVRTIHSEEDLQEYIDYLLELIEELRERRADIRSDSDDEPTVVTRTAVDIDDDSAVLRGRVDMNDFNNGYAFFVYGEDEDEVKDARTEDEYSDIDEDGDDLQTIVVDTDVDGTASYSRSVTGLDDDTKHYVTFCVEYEDEDDDETLECGSVRSFTTDD